MDIEKINKLYHCFDKTKIDSNDDHGPMVPVPSTLEPKLLPRCDTDQFCPDLNPVNLSC